MKNILMIATGGTIASKNTGDGLAPSISAEEILQLVPEIGQICNVATMQPFYCDSTNVYNKHWILLATLIQQNYDKYDGFVITHGTDTMAYTAAALSYLIQNNAKPVVLTGSQKSIYVRDTDARSNLIDAFSYCVDNGACGVSLVFDGKVIIGTRARKTRTKSFNAFSSIDYPEIALMRDGKPVYYIKNKVKGKPKFYNKLDDKIFVLKMMPGMHASIFSYLKKHYDGVIIETFGSGGLPMYEDDAFFANLKDFIAAGKTVVIGTQVEREGSALDVYEVGKRLCNVEGILEARSMTVESTFAKLMWVLGQTKQPARIKKLFETPINFDIF